MASLIRTISSSSDVAWLWHPRRFGTEAISMPSESLSMTTLNSLLMSALLDMVDATQVKGRSQMGAPFDYTTIRLDS